MGIAFQKNRNNSLNSEGSFLQKRKKELENMAPDMILDDFTAPVHSPENVSDDISAPVPAEVEEKTEPKQETPKGGSRGEAVKKNFIRKTIAIEEEVFMQLQLIKAYHRIDHQDIIAVAVKEFLKRHTADGKIKDSDLKSVLARVDELKKQ